MNDYPFMVIANKREGSYAVAHNLFKGEALAKENETSGFYIAVPQTQEHLAEEAFDCKECAKQIADDESKLSRQGG